MPTYDVVDEVNFCRARFRLGALFFIVTRLGASGPLPSAPCEFGLRAALREFSLSVRDTTREFGCIVHSTDLCGLTSNVSAFRFRTVC